MKSIFASIALLTLVAVPLQACSDGGATRLAFEPEMVRIPAGSFLVVSGDPDLVKSRHAVTQVLGPWSGRLANSSEKIELKDTLGEELANGLLTADQSTEVGIAVIHPFVSERAETRGGGKNKLERWRRIAVESCKQCGRRQLPRIEPLEALSGAPEGDSPALLLQPGPGSTPLSDLCDGPAPSSVQIAVGPQSGFTPEEVETHERAGWRSTALGPRILRADTAGAITAAILLHRWGDLG